ncbi:MAG: hypothetical protein ACOX2F_08455 [bacterium]
MSQTSPFLKKNTATHRPLSLFLPALFVLFFFVSCNSRSTENHTPDDLISIADSDTFSYESPNENEAETETRDNDVEDSDLSDNDAELPDYDDDSFKDTFTLENECFGKKVLTKEIVEVDKYGDGFENEVNSDYMYQIDRYYDKNCRIKFEVKYKINTDDIAGIWDGSHSPSYEYDDKGNVKKICHRKKDGTLKSCGRYSYEFDSAGRVIKMCKGMTTEDRDVGCVYYFYDESGKLKQRIRNTGCVRGYLEFYRNYSEIGAEFFADDYSIGVTTYDREERIDYFYDEKGRISKKERYFLFEEYDENDYMITRRGYNVVNRMIGKFKIGYDYNSVKLPVKSSHYEIYQEDFKDFYTAEYERNYFYDEKMRPAKITTNCISCGPMWKAWLDEWEYYHDGTLKRHRASLDKGGGYEEKTYDEKGREITYKEVEYTGNIWKTEEKTYYEETENVKTNYLCFEDRCNLWDYSYEFDEFKRKTSVIGLYDYDTLGTRYGDGIYYKYDNTGRTTERRIYTVWHAKDDTELTKSQRAIDLYTFDEKGRLVETRSSQEWDEEGDLSIDEMWISSQIEYDSFDRIINELKVGRHYLYTYHGETKAKNKVWLKNGIITYEYDEKGNLVSEVYKDPGGSLNSDSYIFEFIYNKSNNMISSTKGDHYSSRKENHKYFYTIFEE